MEMIFVEPEDEVLRNTFLKLKTMDQLKSDVLEHPVVNTSEQFSKLPEKSRQRYEIALERLEDWCAKNKFNTITEKALVQFFEEKCGQFRPSTLWVRFYMLKAIINIKYKIDIRKYSSLMTLLNSKLQGYKRRKSRIFTRYEISKFLAEADDHKYLFLKVALIIGLSGACTKGEMANLRLQDMQYRDNSIDITTQEAKSDSSRRFSVGPGNIKGVNLVNIVKKYASLRPADITIDRFFLQYIRGKCIRTPVGVNIFGTAPKKIAEFLGLPCPEQFTGRCFKRSASMLAESVVDLLTSYIPSTNLEVVVVKQENQDSLDTYLDAPEIFEPNLDIPDVYIEDLDVKITPDMISESSEDNCGSLTNFCEATSTPIAQAVKETSQVPQKSRHRYEAAFAKFENWRIDRKVQTIDEKVLIDFFTGMTEDFKCSTLMAQFSMLKSMLNINYKVDIGKYHDLIALLNCKSKNDTGEVKKARSFTREEITKFLVEADDQKYLFMKVALIIGLSGACTKAELTYLRAQDLKYHDNFIEITTRDNRIDPSRHFLVTSGNIRGVNLVEIVKKYASLRPSDIHIDRFFIQYIRGKCAKQPVGINIFGTTPKRIAEYLGLPCPEQFTGRSFKISAPMLAESVVDLLASI